MSEVYFLFYCFTYQEWHKIKKWGGESYASACAGGDPCRCSNDFFTRLAKMDHYPKVINAAISWAKLCVCNFQIKELKTTWHKNTARKNVDVTTCPRLTTPFVCVFVLIGRLVCACVLSIRLSLGLCYLFKAPTLWLLKAFCSLLSSHVWFGSPVCRPQIGYK